MKHEVEMADTERPIRDYNDLVERYEAQRYPDVAAHFEGYGMGPVDNKDCDPGDCTDA